MAESVTAALLAVSLTVQRHRRHRRPLVSVVVLPACSRGTSILLYLPCKCFHIPINSYPHDQRNVIRAKIGSFMAHTLIWVRKPPFGEIQYRRFWTKWRASSHDS
jgi:hypothetical protein